MKHELKHTSIKNIIERMEKGTIKFDNPFIRTAGAWDKKMKVGLIHSLMRGFDINAISGYRENDIFQVLDGHQRLTVIYDFINDRFENEDNLTFSKLLNEDKETILNTDVMLVEYYDLTPEDQKEIFEVSNI